MKGISFFCLILIVYTIYYGIKINVKWSSGIDITWGSGASVCLHWKV